MPKKIPETRLQALHDGLRLLELMTTEKAGFDQVEDVAARVGWFGMSRLAGQLRQALQWVKDQAAKQRYPIRRHDCPGALEHPYRVWFGAFTAWSESNDPLLVKARKEGMRLARKQIREQKRPEAAAADPLNLFYQGHSHLRPKEE
jgi:hypothetical protein